MVTVEATQVGEEMNKRIAKKMLKYAYRYSLHRVEAAWSRIFGRIEVPAMDRWHGENLNIEDCF